MFQFENWHRKLSPKWSTTPISPANLYLIVLSIKLKGKHYRKLHCHNGVVDHLGLNISELLNTFLIIFVTGPYFWEMCLEFKSPIWNQHLKCTQLFTDKQADSPGWSSNHAHAWRPAQRAQVQPLRSQYNIRILSIERRGQYFEQGVQMWHVLKANQFPQLLSL